VQVPGLYLHVPFCFHKCHYCDFYSLPRQAPERMERFVDLVLREAQGWADGARGPAVRPITLFFGGGTPSLLPLEAMHRLLAGLGHVFDLSGVTEWTLECNPATVDEVYCRMLRESGVNRLSFGAQSFDERELALLERHHLPDDVYSSVAAARAAGFKRLNLDLIYAIPGQTMRSWEKSLDTALGLETEHLSCYGLTYEPNTPISVRRRSGEIVAAEEALELAMLHHTRRRLAAAGLPAYEISNHARTGAECRQNLLYWNGGSYIGLGPAAASHVQGWRWKDRSDLGAWEAGIERGEVPAADVECLTPSQRVGELAMLQLRLTRGIDFDDFHGLTGVDARREFADLLPRLAGLGLIEQDEQGIRLTASGLNVADAVAGEFIG
jgi:oxygen-independent coproporphyrinogen-3 oxidase